MQMAEKLWDLANLVTGFAAVQSIAFIYGLVSQNLKIKGREAHWSAAIGTTVFTFLYVVAVIWCGSKGRSLEPQNHPDVWGPVTLGRVFIIVLFAVMTAGTIYVHRRDESREQSN